MNTKNTIILDIKKKMNITQTLIYIKHQARQCKKKNNHYTAYPGGDEIGLLITAHMLCIKWKYKKQTEINKHNLHQFKMGRLFFIELVNNDLRDGKQLTVKKLKKLLI